MQGKVTRKSPYGFQVEGKEGWVSYGKYYKGTKDFEVGAIVEYEVKVNGEFTNLTSLSVVSTEVPTNGHNTVAKVNKSHGDFRPENARQTAVNAVLGSNLLDNMDYSEAISEIKTLVPMFTNYIVTGRLEVVQTPSGETTDATK